MKPSHLNGNTKIFTAILRRFALATALLVFVSWTTCSFASDQPTGTALSKALTGAKLFAGLIEAERSALESVATLRRGKANERIIEQGKVSDTMFIVMEGRVEIRVNGKHVTTLSGQSLVGEIGFLDTLPASADVVLAEDTDLIELNNAALTALMEQQPRLGYVVMREIARIEAQRIRDANRK